MGKNKKVNTIDSNIVEDKVVSSDSSTPTDVKYRVLFLANRKLLGEIHKEGDSIEVEAWVYETYKTDTRLQFDLIS